MQLPPILEREQPEFAGRHQRMNRRREVLSRIAQALLSFSLGGWVASGFRPWWWWAGVGLTAAGLLTEQVMVRLYKRELDRLVRIEQERVYLRQYRSDHHEV
jgi:hypothetical protein